MHQEEEEEEEEGVMMKKRRARAGRGGCRRNKKGEEGRSRANPWYWGRWTRLRARASWREEGRAAGSVAGRERGDESNNNIPPQKQQGGHHQLIQ